MNAPLAFMDTETDGLHPGRQAWEIAIIRREPDGKQIEWQAFVEINLSTADPMGLKIGRFYNRHPLGRRIAGDDNLPQPWREGLISNSYAAMEVANLTHGAHIVGAVPSFDTEVLNNLLRSEGLIPAWHYHLIDIEVLALGHLAAHGLRMDPPYRSDDLTAAMRVEPAAPEERHTALGDARWAMRMYDAAMDGIVQPLDPRKEES